MAMRYTGEAARRRERLRELSERARGRETARDVLVEQVARELERLVDSRTTYGAISRQYPQYKAVLDDALIASTLEWNPNEAAPSKVAPKGWRG